MPLGVQSVEAVELSGHRDTEHADEAVSSGQQPTAAYTEADDTSVRRRPDAVDNETAADGGGAARPTTDLEAGDRDLDWADILVPDVVKDDEEAS